MGISRSERGRPAIAWWRRIWARVVVLLIKISPPKELPASFSTADLPVDLQALYARVKRSSGLVADTVDGAIADFQHLREVVMGPGATADAVDDVTLLADAEEALREMLRMAPELQTLVELAGQRRSDRKGREATGEAMLAFRDRGRALHDLASAALQWASSRSAEDLARMQGCAANITACELDRRKRTR